MSPLRVVQDKPRIRRSRAARWRAAVLIAVHVAIAAHIAHWLLAGETVTPVEPSEAMAFAKGGVINAGLIFFAAAIALTAVFGRLFCGWACHLVALQDLCRWLLEKVGIRPQPLRSRLLALVPLGAFVYMFLWPVAYRLWIGDSFAHVETELTTSAFWATFPGLTIGVLTFLVCGFAIVYLLGAKGFCTYACPYGAIFGAADRVAPMRIRVTDACAGCGHCTAVCTSNVRVHEEVRDYGMVVDPGCMKCQDCVSVCPNDALYYGPGPIPLFAKPRVAVPTAAKRRPKWWEETTLAVAFIAAFFTFRGLYGMVPFLMSLGLAAILAYLVLVVVQLLVRPHVARRRIRLKRAGKLLPAGRAYLALVAAVLVFWGHSAVVRGHHFLGEGGYRETLAWHGAALDPTAELPFLGRETKARLGRARRHLERVRELGLFATRGNASRLAWVAFFEGAPAFDPAARTAAARGEDAATMHRLLARAARDGGDPAAAAAELERAIAAAPSTPGPWLDLGILLAGTGDLAAAREVFDRGRREVADAPLLVYNAALVRALQGETGQAASLFEETLVLAPGHREARENLAGLLASMGRYEESIVHFRLALEQAPDDTATRLLLARALMAAGRLDEAEAELVETVRIEPGQRDARQLLGDLALQRGGRGQTERVQ